LPSIEIINMPKPHSLRKRFFDHVILEHPGLTIICLLAVISFLGYNATNFEFDASAETLVIENDKDLRYSRLIDSRYGLQDYLLITYTPKDDLFSKKVLANLTRLRDELKQLESVSSVISILDVPLLESPPVPIKDLASNIQTLESPTVDIKLAKKELKKIDEIYMDLLNRRYDFREKQAGGRLSAEEKAEFKRNSEQFQKYRDKKRKNRHRDIVAIREIMNKYRQDAELFLGGVSMIADDLISFIKNDLKVFGLGVLFFLVVTLTFIFRRPRWIFLPMLCCAFSVIAMMGLLGMFGWEVTVISSNQRF